MEYLTTDEVAAELKVARKTVRRWIQEGKLKASKAGRAWRVSRENFEAFLKEGASTKEGL